MIPSSDDFSDFLVIGAGLAGLAFAQDVQTAGGTVRLLDKGRGVGGRCATRRWVETRVDHGAQYFTARSERLQGFVADAVNEGWLRVWSHGFPVWRDGAIIERDPGHPRYAPTSGMSELAKRLAEGLDVRTGQTVARIERTPDGSYQAHTEEGETFTGRSLVLNLPPVQLVKVTGAVLSADLRARVESVTFWPAWALLVRLESDIPGAEWPAVEFDGHPTLGWVARDHTRRVSGPPVLVAHASGPWSESHLEMTTDEVTPLLLDALREVFGPLSVLETQTHRWRYALPTAPLPEKHLWDESARVGVCGDWCGGPRVEGAIESGWSLAANVVTR